MDEKVGSGISWKVLAGVYMWLSNWDEERYALPILKGADNPPLPILGVVL